MSVSAEWHCSTSVTMLSWLGKTWQSCSLRLAVSSGLLSVQTPWPWPVAPYCFCFCPMSHPFPCPLPLPLPAAPKASSAPPSVRSRKLMTSVWERGCLEELKDEAEPAKEWFPGFGLLKDVEKENEASCEIILKGLDKIGYLGSVTYALNAGSHPGEALLFQEGHQGPWSDPRQKCTEEDWTSSNRSQRKNVFSEKHCVGLCWQYFLSTQLFGSFR